jgi:hypothetical protein
MLREIKDVLARHPAMTEDHMPVQHGFTLGACHGGIPDESTYCLLTDKLSHRATCAA